MRFMLRGGSDAATPQSGRVQEQRWALPPSSSSGAPAAAAASALPLPGVRLVVIPDDATTAVRPLDTTITALGALVSGRRSFGGANKAVEAEAHRRVGAPGGAAPGGEKEAPARGDARGDAGKKREREGGGGGGGGVGGGGVGGGGGRGGVGKQPRRLR